MKLHWKSVRGFWPYALLLLIAIAGYWPLTTGLFALKNDDIAYFLPYRFNVVENLRNGFLPLWSPYIYLGFPLAGDMQSGAWNPMVWFLALLGRYDHTSLVIEIIGYIFLAGTGMFRLLKEFGSTEKPALALAVAFMFCGFILDSGQILCWVACAAILPFTYLYLTRLLRHPNGRNAALFALANCMLIAVGYPAFFIINLYVYAYVILTQAVGRPFKELSKTLIWPGFSALLFLVAGSLIWCSVYEMLPFYRRGAGIDLAGVLENSYHSSFSLSALLPLATTWGKAPFKLPAGIFGNMYLGVLLIPFLLRGLWHKRPAIINCIALLSLLCFLFSLAEEFPLRKFAFNYLPLMNTFRHPANFRIFVIIGCLLISARGIAEFLKDLPAKKKPVLGIFQLLILTLTVTAVIFLFRSHHLFKMETLAGTASALKALANRPGFFNQAMFLNALLQLAFLLPACLMLKAGKINSFLSLHVLNILLIAQPLIFYGWVSSGSPAGLNERIRSSPAGFPVKDLNIPVAEYRSEEIYDYGMFRNVGSFYAHRPLLNASFTSPTTLTTYHSFTQDSMLVKSLAAYPAINFGDSIVSRNGPLVYTRKGAESAIKILSFSPSEIHCEIITREAGICWLFQNNYPGWTVEVDGRPEKIQTVNHSFMGVTIKPGSHTITFAFRPVWLTAAMISTIIGLLICAWLIFKPGGRNSVKPPLR